MDNKRKGGGVRSPDITRGDLEIDPTGGEIEAPEPGGLQADPTWLWENASPKLREELSGNYTAWFGSASPVQLDGDTFVLAVPSHFTKDWIEGRYLDLLRTVLSDTAGRPLDIALLVQRSTAVETAPEEPSPEPADPGNASFPKPAAAPTFHPKYTFDFFVIGSSNRFAHAAALAVAEGPAQAYNPLFIYGDAGLGKTHLLHAIGHYVTEFHPRHVVRYISTEQFMNEFIYAIQHKVIPDFHRRYRAADLLLIDDIQFLEGKE
ncbi:MAG: DnaA/Hda family protein, partial [Actinomycetota bacterium]|nr:DnaA/Hda family protein [Actinomycetota bacterium]